MSFKRDESQQSVFQLNSLWQATSYGKTSLGQQSVAQVMLCTGRQQAVAWKNVDFYSKVFCSIDPKTISQEMLLNLIRNMCS